MELSEVMNLRQRTEYESSIKKLIESRKKECDKIRDGQDFIKDKESLRLEYIDMLGYPLTDAKMRQFAPRLATKELISSENGVDIFRLQIEVAEGFFSYGIIFKPTKIEGKLPLIIAQHGGDGTPEMVGGLICGSANYNHLVERAVAYKTVVYAPQLLLWETKMYGEMGDRREYDTTLKQMGGSITALEIFCIIKSIDFFVKKSYIDASKVGMIGLSYGGMYTLATTALDTRIKCALSSCFFNDRWKFNWSDWAYKNQGLTFMDTELAKLVLPRNLYIEVAKNDALFLACDAEPILKDLKGWSVDNNCENNFNYKIFEGVHELDPEQDGYKWFFDRL